MSCGDDSSDSPTTAPPTTQGVTTTASPTTTTTVPTTTTIAPALRAGLIWIRVPDDEAVFGSGQRMTSVTTGGPGLVAVGNDWSSGHETPAVWTSIDGFVWSRAPHDEAVFGSNLKMYSVVAGGPGLVAVGDSQAPDSVTAAVWTSVDGITWSRVPHDEALFGGGNRSISSVAVGGPGLVAVGYDASGMDSYAGAVWTSVDGIAWSRVPHDEALFGGGTFINSVAVGGPGLVAGGYEGWPDSPQPVVWTSVDGLAWSRATFDPALDGNSWHRISSVVAGGPGLVAVGSEMTGDPEAAKWSAAVWTSVDGLVWSQVPDQALPSGATWMHGVVAGGPGLVAIGEEFSDDESLPIPAVWTSIDGLAWSQVPRDQSVFGDGVALFSLTAAGPGLVAVGADYSGNNQTAAVWVSPPPG